MIDQMMKETHNLTQNILHQTAIPNEPEHGTATATVSERDIIKTCILYLRQMADGKLTHAEKTFSRLSSNKKTALGILASMMRAERPEPELSDLAEGVLHGLIRDVTAKLS